MLRSAALGLSIVLLTGCGWFGIGTPPKDQNQAATEKTAGGEGDGAKGSDGADGAGADGKEGGGTDGSGSNDTQKEVVKRLSKAEIEAALAPAEGAMDVRPIIGTDPDQVMPAVFADVRKGMTPAELNEVFVGVARYKVQFLTVTTATGKVWYRVMGTQPHKEVINIEYDDNMKLDEVGYMFDPKKSNPELWAQVKKAAGLKWGKPELGELDEASKYARWKPEGVSEIEISGGSDDNLVTISVKL